MKSQKIEIIQKKFCKEWLLIAVGKMDESTTTPLTGRLLAHSRNRDEIYKKSMRYKKPAMILPPENVLPSGWAVAFYA